MFSEDQSRRVNGSSPFPPLRHPASFQDLVASSNFLPVGWAMAAHARNEVVFARVVVDADGGVAIGSVVRLTRSDSTSHSTFRASIRIEDREERRGLKVVGLEELVGLLKAVGEEAEGVWEEEKREEEEGEAVEEEEFEIKEELNDDIPLNDDDRLSGDRRGDGAKDKIEKAERESEIEIETRTRGEEMERETKEEEEVEEKVVQCSAGLEPERGANDVVFGPERAANDVGFGPERAANDAGSGTDGAAYDLKPLTEGDAASSGVRIRSKSINEFNCDACGRVFKYQANFIKHSIAEKKMMRLTRKSRAKLPDTTPSPSTTATTAATPPTTPLKTTLECKTCRALVPLDDCVLHQKFVHSTASFDCLVCSRSFVVARRLVDHLKTHSKDEGHDYFFKAKCSKCSLLCDIKMSATHAMLDHGAQVPTCIVCSRVYECEEKLRDHLREYHSPKMELCDHCGISLTKKRMQKHLIDKHKPKIWVCEICQETFSVCSRLTRHLSTKHSNPQTHLCGKCGKRLKSRVTLRTHLTRVHGEKMFKCLDCNKTFATNGVLGKHWLRIHGDSRNFVCEICEKSFKTKSDMRSHQSSHRKEKSVSCSDCHKKFTRKSTLLSHQRKYCVVGQSTSNGHVTNTKRRKKTTTKKI